MKKYGAFSTYCYSAYYESAECLHSLAPKKKYKIVKTKMANWRKFHAITKLLLGKIYPPDFHKKNLFATNHLSYNLSVE